MFALNIMCCLSAMYKQNQAPNNKLNHIIQIFEIDSNWIKTALKQPTQIAHANYKDFNELSKHFFSIFSVQECVEECMQCDTCVAFAQTRNTCYICRTDQSLGYAIDSSFVQSFYVSNDYLEQGKIFIVLSLLNCNSKINNISAWNCYYMHKYFLNWREFYYGGWNSYYPCY